MSRRNIEWEVAAGCGYPGSPLRLSRGRLIEMRDGSQRDVAADIQPIMCKLLEMAFAAALPWCTVAWLWIYLLR
jgi:hypothetical protein